MASNYFVGQRLSYDNVPCTIRYIGPVEGTQGEWLGVEWDYESRGKHDGEHKGVRYFETKRISKDCASFVRPARKPDSVESFVEAVQRKYATEEVDRRDELALKKQELQMAGGKIAYEVGFDKIRAQLAQLHELKIVIVDGMKIVSAQTVDKRIREICPKIVELDLSRNLFQSWDEIINICAELDDIRSLTLSGNRFEVPDCYELFDYGLDPIASMNFSYITNLRIDETLLSWGETCNLANQFGQLLNLDASSNQLQDMYAQDTNASLQGQIESLRLEHNLFERLDNFEHLTELTSLKSLHLKGNKISKTCARYRTPIFSPNLTFVDLSSNAIDSWAFIDALNHIFPGMTSLRISHNPIMSSPAKSASDSATAVDETFMLTVARLPNLTSLNFSTITEADRTNAEMFYLSRIGQEIAAVDEEMEVVVTHAHKRYKDLCEIYGAPTVVRQDNSDNPNFLESRLIRFAFTMPAGTKEGQMEDEVQDGVEIPKGWDTYRIKSLVGKLFDHRPLGLRLVWETGEWDPVAGYEDAGEDSEVEDEQDDGEMGDEENEGEEEKQEKEKGKWVQREVEIEDGTRQIGFLIDDKKANVRVEII